MSVTSSSAAPAPGVAQHTLAHITLAEDRHRHRERRADAVPRIYLWWRESLSTTRGSPREIAGVISWGSCLKSSSALLRLVLRVAAVLAINAGALIKRLPLLRAIDRLTRARLR